MLPDPTTTPLHVEGLECRHGADAVVRDLDLSVGEAELVVMLGASGCGKTTLLRSIAGLLTPHAGTIQIGEQEVARDGRSLVPPEKRKIGLVFQEYALFPSLTVRENVRFGAPDNHRRVDRLIELVGLDGFSDRHPSELSGGQQQRAALARALAPQPHLLLLDEPFANVDAALKGQLGHELRRVLAERRTAAVMVTHDRMDALELASRVAVMINDGDGARIAQIDTPQMIYERPNSEAVAKLTGDVSVIDGEANLDRVECALGTYELIEGHRGPVRLVVRPDRATFAAGPGETEVTGLRYQGGRFRLRCRTPAGLVWVDTIRGAPPAVGTLGHVRLDGPVWAVPQKSANGT